MCLLKPPFTSFAVWAFGCAVAVCLIAMPTLNERSENKPAGEYRGDQRDDHQLFHTASAHFPISIARSACTAVYPKEAV